MTRLKASGLPPAVRAQLEAADGKRKAKSRAGVGDATPCQGRCECGQTFAKYTAWERHAGDPGHRRWAIALPDVPAVPTVPAVPVPGQEGCAAVPALFLPVPDTEADA